MDTTDDRAATGAGSPARDAATHSTGEGRDAPAPWPRRVMWLILIWLASVTALGAAAYVMRLLMRAAGMAS